MGRRQPLPYLWLMTDERIGDLAEAVRRLPRDAGIVFRHYATPRAERRMLFAATRQLARRRGLILVLAGSVRDAIGWRADGVHNAGEGAPRRLIRTAAAHGRRELCRAARLGADLAFLSPVFPTRTHPGAPALGRVRFRAIARTSRLPVIALGGMNARRARGLGAYGWAAIDAWDGGGALRPGGGHQKRKVVPK